MILALFGGACVGTGLLVLARALLPPRRTIASVLAELDASARFVSVTRLEPRTTGGFGRRLEILELLVGERAARELVARGWLARSGAADLRLLGCDPIRYTVSRVAWAVCAFVAVPCLDALLTLVGFPIPLVVGVWLALVAGAVGFFLPAQRVRAAAAERRRDFRTAISVYLDLVAMRAASGAGIAEALLTAAEVGEGWAFARLRAALSSGRTDGLSPARALGRLGAELGIPELEDLAAHLALVDVSGAQAETSLRAKADTLRERQLSDAHGRANERSQNMLIAQVLLGLAFLVFIGYPAMARVIAS